MIGITYKAKPVFGLIHQLCREEPRTFWGGQGVGVYATTDNTYGTLLSAPGLPSAWKVAVSQHHTGDLTNALVNALNPPEVLRIGGAGFKIMSVLLGDITDYFQCESGLNKWDTCAGEALLSSAGGFVTDIRGRSLSYEADGTRNEGVITTLDPEHLERVVTEASKILPVKGFL
mmetsp:Transcript_20444/g.38277  ORF Transcript_20444/g.38277 Transcript_20444/m.38277 type:complete len:174 (-) Transcript_20444:6995-7516(-)